MLISYWGTVNAVVRKLMINGGGWSSVNKIGGCRQRLYPIDWRLRGLDEESAHGVVECAKNTFNLAVLCRGVWAGGVKNYVVCNKCTMHGVVNKLCAIISLKAFNR
jgi:hypothetical protein